jgi:hypothetical protein
VIVPGDTGVRRRLARGGGAIVPGSDLTIENVGVN